jgi:eukaryotic-like serine/threonine-protein kinase
MVPVQVQKGDILGGKYRLDEVIGEGAMGVVVSAWHIDLQQRVAIKFLHPLLAEREDAVERFLREARAVVRIESEHVARVLDVGRLEGAAPYLVMEFLEGEDLAATLQRRRPLPLMESVTYLQQACEAIAEAHAAGIVHRDLKPANLFLLERGAEPARIKVLDFGISKTAASSERALLTNTSVIMGSPIYMSPEQLRSTRDVDGKTDIWALGVILYEMLTGHEPFVAQTLPQLCAMILEGSPAAPRSLRPEIPIELERVVLRCLEKAPEARFSSVAELSLALVPFGAEAARASAERAARSLQRTGSRSKSSLPPPVDQASNAPPRSVQRRRVGVFVAVLFGAAVIAVLLVRGCEAERSTSSVAAGAAGRPAPSASGGGVPATAQSEVSSTAPAPVLPPVEPATRSTLPAKLARAAPGPSRMPPAAIHTVAAASSAPAPQGHATSVPRSGFDPPADDFGGRE